MRKLLVFLIVLVALVVGADFLGRYIAESKVGEAIATQAKLSPAPGVDIHGFSFLWQAVQGEYEHVSILSTGLAAGELKGLDAGVELYQVKLPLSDAISGTIDNLVAGRADVTLRIPAASLKDALRLPELTITAGDAGALRFGSTIAVAGQPITLAVDVTVTASNNTLHLRGGKISGAPAGIPATLTTQAASQFTLDIPLVGLPVDLTDATASLDGTTVVVTGAAKNVPIGDLISSGR